jgi:molecular chaperone Hsp33
MSELKNLAKYKRYLIEDTNLLVVRGSIAPVITGMGDYNSRHGIAPSPEDLRALIQELLAATALSAVSLTARESWGWSLTFKGMNIGFFIGVEPEGMICLRILEAETEKASAMVQRQKAGLPMTQSHITPQTRSPREMVEQYFSEVDQTRTRLEVKEDGDSILVHALPGGNFDAVRDLDADKLFGYADSAIGARRIKELGDVLVFYECRCSDKMISEMIDNMAESDRMYLFGDLQHVEIECPRCARKYTVTRNSRNRQVPGDAK